MASNLRVGRMHAYQPYREVEPVPAYPRIDPQQPRDEYPQQQGYDREDADGHVRRRFTTMRKLIDELKQEMSVSRVDYMTAEQEMVEIGLTIADEQMVTLLSELGLVIESTDDCFHQLRQRTALPDLGPDQGLSETQSFLPVYVGGLTGYRLTVSGIKAQMRQRPAVVSAAIERDGFYAFERERIKIVLYGDQISDRFSLDIAILVGISEVDEAGRKAVLYQRRDRSLALYADKQISLSI